MRNLSWVIGIMRRLFDEELSLYEQTISFVRFRIIIVGML